MDEPRGDAQVPGGVASRLRRRGRGLRPSLGWKVLAAVVLAVGVTASSVAGTAVARANGDRSRHTFDTSAAAIASGLRLAIEHEDDLVVNAAAFLALNPDATTAEFTAWATSARVLERFPELTGLGHIVLVSRQDLAAYIQDAMPEPDATGEPAAPFEVSPPGDRPLYCFARLGIASSDGPVSPPGLDLCASSTRDDLLGARDSGRGTSAATTLVPGLTSLAWQQPIYLGEEPQTVAGRRAAFVGWAGYSIDPQILLADVLADHPGTAVSFTQGSTTFRRGGATGSASRSVDLGNGWTVVITGDAGSGSLLRDQAALGFTAVGVVGTALLAALILVLASGRSRALAMVSDKTDELRHQALHDALTALPNRTLIVDRLEQMLARSRRQGTSRAALFVDLDGFKDVNDTLGHDAGDQLLRAAAERLGHALRDVDTIGRLGGDEFVVLIDGGAPGSGPDLVAERILGEMRRPFTVAGAPAPIQLTASIGMAVDHGDTPADVLRDADMALYAAKAGGRDRVEVFQPGMEVTIRHRYALEVDLRASAADEMRLVYQPIYDLSDLTIVGVEALLRWDHPTRGELQPEEFVPLLEASGQILEVGRWVLATACGQVATWRAQGSALAVAVNISRRQLDDPALVEDVRDALSSSGLDPASLTLDITEAALMQDIDQAATVLRELKGLGVGVAIDDFATGASILAHLPRLAIDCLKIDRTFTRALTTSPEADTLVHTIVGLCADLGLKAVAEGVETTEQIDQLRVERVAEIQGFLLARPLRPEDLELTLLEPARPTGHPLDT